MTSATTAFDAIVKVRETLRSAPPKPREWWVNVYPTMEPIAYFDLKSAVNGCQRTGKTVHVREVMPDDDKPKFWMPEWDDLIKDQNNDFISGAYWICAKHYNCLRNKLMSLEK